VPAPSIAALRAAEGGETFRNARGSVVGRLSPDKYLEKRGLCFESHHLHRFGGWATEASHLDQLEALGGRGIRLLLTDGRTLESTIEDWRRHSYQPPSLESRQRVLPDRYWRVMPAGGATQLALIV
jgi:hypothetical protein